MGRLKTLAPRVASIRQTATIPTPKQTDPYYLSPEWKALRAERLALDSHVCVVCGAPAVVVDHRVSRRWGGEDVLSNLRSLCRKHDNAAKERTTGDRKSLDVGVGGFGHGGDLS